VQASRHDGLPATVILTNRFKERRGTAEHEPDSPLRAELQPGDQLSRFRILERLGGGGMGIVYRAADTELQRIVALKILPPHLCRSPEYVSRFRAEARAQARFNNPHVITLYSFLELPEGEVLVLEYVEGETLAERLRRAGPLPVSEALRIFEQALLGVEHIHRMGVVHRDLKPSNIFITGDERVKLMDFGVAKLTDTAEAWAQGAMVGTLLYISPEQINGRETDFRSDVYTMGISLFETVTGRLPFERRSDYALMHAHVQEAPPRPKHYHRRIPQALEWVMLKAIEKQPERRFQNAAEFRVALLKLGLIERRHRAGRPATAQATPVDSVAVQQAPARNRLLPRNRLPGGIGVDLFLVGVALCLVLLLGLWPGQSAGPPAPSPAVSVDSKKAAPKTVTRAAAPAPLSPKPAKRPPAPVAANPTADKYDTLRNAWSE
jgi:serine/threonine-protein kinase